MIIGVPREIKDHEYRVALTPKTTAELVGRGHRVLIETGAGAGAGFDDGEYQRAGAAVAKNPEEIYGAAELVVKVKEPLVEECKQFRAGQMLFAYLHLAANPEQANLLKASGATCLAFETLENSAGELPLLAPMSEIAGRLATQAGAVQLQREHGGRGVLLSGAAGIGGGKVTVIGGGTVGANAAWVAWRLGARVRVLDTSKEKLDKLSAQFAGEVACIPSTPDAIAECSADADLLVGAVLIAGARTPHIVTRTVLRAMNTGSVFVDVAIDQGGCSETSRVTTYSDPTYVEEEVIHYCVGNMPAAVPRTASQALSKAILPYLLKIADGGQHWLASDPELATAVNIHQGRITNTVVRHAVDNQMPANTQ